MLKVMIVDNEAVIRKGLTQCIDWESLGCVISTQASDGQDALRKMAQCPADIVISDIRMPGMDGLALVRELAERYPRTQVIMLTGYSDFEYAQSAIQYRVADYLLKPTSQEKLSAAVARARDILDNERNAAVVEQALKEQERANALLRQNLLLHDMLSGKQSSMLYVRERLGRLGLDLNSYFVVQLYILSGGEQRAQLAEDHVEESIKMLSHVFDEDELRCVLIDGPAYFAVYLGQDARALRNKLEEYTALIENMTEFYVLIGVSTQKSDPLSIQTAAKEAADARDFLRFESSRSSVFFDELPQLNEGLRDTALELLRHIGAAIEQHDPAQTDPLLKSFGRLISDEKIPFSQVRNMVSMIHSMCISTLINNRLEGCVTNGVLPPVETLLLDFSPDILETRVRALVTQTISLIQDNMAETDSIIPMLRSYINQHLQEDLSLTLLSAVAHLSPTYLSKLFKKETGQNISGYILDIRVERAKTLLRTTQQKTYEIAKAVGIDDPVYFSRLFKKATGLKPKDYRLSLADNADG